VEGNQDWQIELLNLKHEHGGEGNGERKRRENRRRRGIIGNISQMSSRGVGASGAAASGRGRQPVGGWVSSAPAEPAGRARASGRGTGGRELLRSDPVCLGSFFDLFNLLPHKVKTGITFLRLAG